MSLKAKKLYMPIDDSMISNISDTFVVNTIFTVADTNTANVSVQRVVGLQGDNIIEPSSVKTDEPQINTKSTIFGSNYYQANIATIATFQTSDIDWTKPLIVKVITASAKELTFHFNIQNYGNTYKYGTDDYKF
jgi:hypothetical protein